MIQYRFMKPEDCRQVEELYQACFSHPWTLHAIEEMFTVEGYVSLVAEEEEHIVGYIGMKTVCDEADITNVAVAPSVRRQGIAHTLLERLLTEAEKGDICSIFLEVRVSNDPAITLYQHAGFEDCGRRKNYYDKPTEDALIMVWKADSVSDIL